MKQLISRTGVLLLAVLLTLSVLAAPVLALDNNNGAGGVLSVDAKKKAELFVIDKTITLLNVSTASAARLAAVSPESAQETIDFINGMVAKLNDFETQVNAATTIEELNTINADLKAYLVASKDEYRAQVHSIVASFADDAYKKAEQYIKIADTTLESYKAKCPGQTASITNVQNQLDQLSAASAALNTAIQASDAAGMKAGIKSVSSLMVSITAQLEALDTAVWNGIDTTCNIY